MAEAENPSLRDVRRRVEQLVVEKAQADSEFRARLLADPNAALEEVLGQKNPTQLKVRVIEEQPGEAVIVLPRADTDELPDELLDLAAGGTSFSAFILYGPNDAPPKGKKH